MSLAAAGSVCQLKMHLHAVACTLQTAFVETTMSLKHGRTRLLSETGNWMVLCPVLRFLGFVDASNVLTADGKLVVGLQLEPRLARALLASVDKGCSHEALAVVCMIKVSCCTAQALSFVSRVCAPCQAACTIPPACATRL